MRDRLLALLALTTAGLVAIGIGVAASTSDESSAAMPDDAATATFAGGCFWCTEAAFDMTEGVYEAISGYTGGSVEDPTYEQVTSGTTGHAESVRVSYDPGLISYDELLTIYWRTVDPTDAGGQLYDRGSQYRTAVFYHDDEQRTLAEASREALAESGRFDEPIVTEVLEAGPFYPAEEYHQDFYLKAPEYYEAYVDGSQRYPFLEAIWGDEAADADADADAETDVETKTGDATTDVDPLESLTPLQHYVTQEDGTEPPFDNAYWDNKQAGIYVDVVGGDPLFSSTDKYESGTGWPSFTRPIDPSSIVEQEDLTASMRRIEVRSTEVDSHLGHVFSDGPEPTGLRYCINSAALRFIPQEDLEDEGYGEYLSLFE